MKIIKISLISLCMSGLCLSSSVMALGVVETDPSVVDDVPQDGVPREDEAPPAEEVYLMPNKGDFAQAYKFCNQFLSLTKTDFKRCLLEKMASDAKRMRRRT